jgi:hypothetical protein
MSIFLEVSLGEALDKQSILEIKKEKIKDNRNINVVTEYNYLKTKLSEYLTKYDYFYKILKKVNLEIWELQDLLRCSDFSKENFYVVCDEILNLNDSRYLIKKKINELGNSTFKEQKGYNLRCLSIVLNVPSKIIEYLDGAIRYYSFYYDELYIYTNDDMLDLLKKNYGDDLYININNINDFNDINCNYDLIKIYDDRVEKKITHTYFLNKKQVNNNDHMYLDEINKLYEKMNLNVKIFMEYKK